MNARRRRQQPLTEGRGKRRCPTAAAILHPICPARRCILVFAIARVHALAILVVFLLVLVTEEDVRRLQITMGDAYADEQSEIVASTDIHVENIDIEIGDSTAIRPLRKLTHKP